MNGAEPERMTGVFASSSLSSPCVAKMVANSTGRCIEWVTMSQSNANCGSAQTTELEELVAVLRKSEAGLKNIIDNAIEGIFQTDREGLITQANPAFARTHGYGSPDEVIHHMNVRELFVDLADQHSLIALLRATDLVQHFEARMKTREGNIHWVTVNVRVTRDQSRKAVSFEGTMLDISQRKKSEEALLESETKFRNIVGNAIEGIFQTDREGLFTHANPSFARIHGYDSVEEARGHLFARELFLNPADHRRLNELLRTSDSIQDFEAQMKTRDGNIHWVAVNVMVFRDEKGKPVSYEGTMLDITGRKRAEEELRESEERYRVAIESSNDGILMLQDDVCRYANRQYVQMFGFENAEEIVGKSVRSTIHPDDVEMVVNMIHRRQRGDHVPVRYEFKAVKKNQDTFFVEVSSATITIRGKLIDLIYIRDISERKRAEESLMKSHKELERLNKAKSKAVDHISHELKTPLAVIQGVTGIIKRKFENESATGQVELVRTLERNIQRLVEISQETDEIFRTSHELEAGMVINDIEHLLERVEDLGEMPDEIRLHWEALKQWTSNYIGGNPLLSQPIDLYQFTVPMVEKIKQAVEHRKLTFKVRGAFGVLVSIDPYILKEVVESLVKNAIENTPDGGVIEIVSDEKENTGILQVCDTGIGITEENQASLMDGLFHTVETDLYSTKKPYEFGAGGKGLELLRIKHYAERYGFKVSFTSKRCTHIPTDNDLCPGAITACEYCKTVDDCVASGGTTFTVTFPSKT